MGVQLYAHLTWTTFARLPWIDAEVAGFLHDFLPKEARRHAARVLELAVVGDHVHVLLQLPSVFDVPRLVQHLKGASARFINTGPTGRRVMFRWDRGYDLRSVGPRGLSRVAAYLAAQDRTGLKGDKRLPPAGTSRVPELAPGP